MSKKPDEKHPNLGKRWGVQLKLDAMSPEERKAFFERILEKRKATMAARKAKESELRVKAEEMAPIILAQEIIREGNENQRPPQAVIEKLKGLLSEGMTLDEMRKKIFPNSGEKAWNNLTKWLFQDHAPNAEALGLDILSVRRRAMRNTKAYLREIRREIKITKDEAKKKGKRYEILGLLDRKRQAEKDLANMELDIAKVLHTVGAVGSKAKGGGGGVTLNFSIPRPPNVSKDVTPKKVSLADIVTDGD